MWLWREFARGQRYPKPLVIEMGSKDPVIVSGKADLAKAVEGVVRSAFGYAGQKCSATSRVYVQKTVAHRFMQQLKDRVGSIIVGDPRERETFFGPLIDRRAKDIYISAVRQVIAEGGTIETGGEVLAGTTVWKRTLCHACGGYRNPARSSAPQERIICSVPYRQSLQVQYRKQLNTQTRPISALPQESSRKTPVKLTIFIACKGWCNVCQPCRGSNNRCLAGVPVIYRLECEWFNRQGLRGALLSPLLCQGTGADEGFIINRIADIISADPRGT